MHKLQEKRLRDTIKKTITILLEEKPGGGLTDFGALYRVEKNAAIAQARQALVSADGDVDRAAELLDISPSSLRYYLDLQPSLEKTKEKEESRTAGKSSS